MESQDVFRNLLTKSNPENTSLEDHKEQNNHEISAINVQNSATKDSPPEEENKVLGKKIKRNENKKINRELCSICRDGGTLILCDNCPRSFHMECLKIKEENIPEGKWYCPICAPKMQKKLEKTQLMSNVPEDKEKERKRLIKNEKRRLWRLKKKEQLEAIKNSQKNSTILVNKDGNALIESFLNGNKSNSNNNYLDYINKMAKLPFLNSKICINITYTSLSEEDHPNKTLSLPLLFPIPNDILINSNKKINSLDSALNKNSSIKRILNGIKNDENENGNNDNAIIIKYDLILDNNILLDEKEETKKILKTHNSINALNSIIKDNKDIIKYNIILRDY